MFTPVTRLTTRDKDEIISTVLAGAGSQPLIYLRGYYGEDYKYAPFMGGTLNPQEETADTIPWSTRIRIIQPNSLGGVLTGYEGGLQDQAVSVVRDAAVEEIRATALAEEWNNSATDHAIAELVVELPTPTGAIYEMLIFNVSQGTMIPGVPASTPHIISSEDRTNIFVIRLYPGEEDEAALPRPPAITELGRESGVNEGGFTLNQLIAERVRELAPPEMFVPDEFLFTMRGDELPYKASSHPIPLDNGNILYVREGTAFWPRSVTPVDGVHEQRRYCFGSQTYYSGDGVAYLVDGDDFRLPPGWDGVSGYSNINRDYGYGVPQHCADGKVSPLCTWLFDDSNTYMIAAAGPGWIEIPFLTHIRYHSRGNATNLRVEERATIADLAARIIVKLLPAAYCGMSDLDSFNAHIGEFGMVEAFRQFSNVIADRPKIRIRALERTLIEKGHALSSARGTLVSLIREIPELEKEREALETMGLSEGTIEAEWDILRSMPFLENVTTEVSASNLCLDFSPVVFDCETDITNHRSDTWYSISGRKVYIGSYRCNYNYTTHTIEIVRRSGDIASSLPNIHPHIHGSPCFGTSEMLLQSALAEYRISDVALLLWQYLSCCNAGDVWGKDVERWEPFAWEENDEGEVVWGSKPAMLS